MWTDSGNACRSRTAPHGRRTAPLPPITASTQHMTSQPLLSCTAELYTNKYSVLHDWGATLTKSSKNGCNNTTRVNFSRYVRPVTTCSWMLTTACCLVARLWLGIHVWFVSCYTGVFVQLSVVIVLHPFHRVVEKASAVARDMTTMWIKCLKAASEAGIWDATQSTSMFTFRTNSHIKDSQKNGRINVCLAISGKHGWLWLWLRTILWNVTDRHEITHSLYCITHYYR